MQLLLLVLAVAVVIGGIAVLGRIGTQDAPSESAPPATEAESAPPEPRGGGAGLPTGSAGVQCDDAVAAGGDVTAFIAGLGDGETGCLRGGVHIADGVASITSPDVVLTSYPGESATLLGRLWIEPEADGAVVADLTLDGRNPESTPSPTVNADAVVLRGNDITNDHTTICVSVNDYGGEPPPRGVVIENNVIHDCGELPATNHHHGIYIADAEGAVIRDNVIYGNADRGVQLYPDANGSIVTGNIIYGNGQGVIFGGDAESSSDNNLVANNVITDSTIRWNIQSHWQGPVGYGNVARDNCVWSGRGGYYGGGDPDGSGIEEMNGARAFDNVVADPDYADPAAGDFRINPDSPCAEVLKSQP